MKSFLRSLGLLVVAGAVVACGPTPTPASAPQAQVTVPDDGRDQTVVVRGVDGDTLASIHRPTSCD